MLVFQIKLSKNQDTEAFTKFMLKEYFPAVLKVGPTRLGVVDNLALLQGVNEIEGEDFEHEFLLHVDWSGGRIDTLRLDDKDVVRKFESFKARVKRVGRYEKVVARRR